MRPLLGTLVEIRAGGAVACLHEAVEAAFGTIERVHRLMSFHDERSDVSRINAAPVGYEVAVDHATYAVLEFAHELWRRSRGAFDIAIAPSLVREGFLPEPPAYRAVEDGRFEDLELCPNDHVRWRKKGWIDLGGVAKGYAVDAAVTTLRAHGVACGVVNAGGDLRCFGDPAPIHVRSQGRPTELIALGHLTGGAIATSAGYFRQGQASADRPDPIVDPHRGACVAWEASISVLAAHCMHADALTKVVRIAPSVIPGLLQNYDAQAIVIDRLGMRTCGRCWLQLSGVATRDREVAAG